MTDYSHSLAAYDYDLPQVNIAQHPSDKRDQSRLLVVQNNTDKLLHQQFTDIIDHIRPDDIIVVNNTKVFPARLLGHKPTGGKVELFLLEFPSKISATPNGWYQAESIALLKSSKRPKKGSELLFSDTLKASIIDYQDDGKAIVRLRYSCRENETLEDILDQHGQIPLPPYIQRQDGTTDEDKSRYQTKYALHTGSVAAPTAGLHFSNQLLQQLENKGVKRAELTLHVGYGTFAPVRSEDIRNHVIHREHITISQEAATAINEVKKNGGRVWAVGTTTVRTLEFASDLQGQLHPMEGVCDLFIYPGYTFKIVDNLITNFHLPQSSLLFLVSALTDRKKILAAYKIAVQDGYRFFSYGDAMAIIAKP